MELEILFSSQHNSYNVIIMTENVNHLVAGRQHCRVLAAAGNVWLNHTGRRIASHTRHT